MLSQIFNTLGKGESKNGWDINLVIEKKVLSIKLVWNILYDCFQINESFKKFGILDSTTSVLVVIVTQENANEKVCISFIPGIYIC